MTDLINEDGEVVVKLADGWTIRSAAAELTSGEYVRICEPDGTEYIYYHYNEWEEDPIVVMGAIINIAAGLRIKGEVQQ